MNLRKNCDNTHISTIGYKFACVRIHIIKMRAILIDWLIQAHLRFTLCGFGVVNFAHDYWLRYTPAAKALIVGIRSEESFCCAPHTHPRTD